MQKFKNLQELILPTVANTELLEVIARSMKNLKLLDISCSTNVTDFSIMALITDDSQCCQVLEQIFLDGTSITTDGILILLAKMNHLELLESSLLERALDMVPIENRSLNLRKITVGRFWRGMDILQNLPKLCPKLCQIILPNLSPEECNFLQKFQQLPTLQHVYLAQVKYEALLSVLPYFGPQLKTFSYSNFTEYVDLTPLLKICSNLECLGINSGSINLANFQDQLPKKLSELRLNVHALIPFEVWSQFLQVCHELLYLDVTPPEGLNDQSFATILSKNSQILSKIRSFIIRGRHCAGDIALTEQSIEVLTNRSTSLTCIGNCSTWSLLPENCTEFIRF